MNTSFIQNHTDIRSKNTQSIEELEEIQVESKTQALPHQSDIFGTASLRKTRKAVNNLPNPLNPPLGFEANTAFESIYPFVRIPYLQPKTKEDVISFGAPEEGGYLDPKSKKIPLNSIFFGDNLHVLRAIPSDSIDLIYIDPPFFSGREYNQIWGDDNEIRTFNDIWEDGLPSYLVWLNARLWEMRRVLKETGSIYVHCDWHASHYIKTELDKIFGYEFFRNEIVWQRTNAKGLAFNGFPKDHDVIFYYVKSGKYKFNRSFKEYDQEYIKTFYRHTEESTGRQYRLSDLTNPNINRPNLTYEWNGHLKVWRWTKERMQKAHDQGLIQYSSSGLASQKRYLDEMGGQPVDSVWSDINSVQPQSDEKLGYPTQKPEGLLKRIIEVSSDSGDVVADFFLGGGTTAAVAMKLGRKFVGCDISRVAASVTLDRLIDVGEYITNEQASTKEDAKKQISLLQLEKIPNIHLSYVGTYPIEKFNNIDQKTFNEFILTCYGARDWTGQGVITGVMNAATTILIGSSDPSKGLDENTIYQFVVDSLKQRFSADTKMKLKIIAWNFPRQIQKYCKQLEKFFDNQNIQVSLELIPINSEQFRKRITEQYTNKLINESDFLLKFIVSPSIGNIIAKKIDGLKYQFTATGTHSNNLEGFLINCQWDFDFVNGRFSDKEYALMREKQSDKSKQGIYKAVLIAQKEFTKPGKYLVACKVQDNFGAEIIFTKKFTIEE